MLERNNAFRKDIVFRKDDLTNHSTTAASLLNQATIIRDVVVKPLVKQIGFCSIVKSKGATGLHELCTYRHLGILGLLQQL